MNLDELVKRNESRSVQDVESLGVIQSKLQQFDRTMRRNLLLESLLATVAFVGVVTIMLGADFLYPKVVSTLLPGMFESPAQMNVAMYFGLLLMAAYCVAVPIVRFLAQKNSASLSWTLASRVDAEIARMERQRALWNRSHLWSITPAAVIGVSFFWGLNRSLLGTWLPSIYLWVYFVFVLLSVMGALWLKRDFLIRQVQPMLEQLYQVRSDLQRSLSDVACRDPMR